MFRCLQYNIKAFRLEEREESMFIWKKNYFFSNNRRLSAFQLDVGPMAFD